MRDERAGVLWIAHEAWHVTHENEASRLQGDGGLCGSDVCVAIIYLAVFAASRGTDNGRDAAADALTQRFGVHAGDFADRANVDFLASRTREEKFATREDVGPCETLCFAAKARDRLDDFGIDLA